MQARTVADLVKDVVEPIQALSMIKPNADEILGIDKKLIKLLQSIESRIAFLDLTNLLKKYASSKQNLLTENLVPFVQFLTDRWRRIKNTDSAYQMSPSLPINRACRLLAESIAPIENKHIYQLLMPNVIFDSYPEKMHQFIINASSSKSIPLVKCFELLEQGSKVSLRRINSRSQRIGSSGTETTAPLGLSLQLTDERLITSHSIKASEYANAIVHRSDLEVHRQSFIKALDSDQYEMTASYGEEGRRCLLDNLLINIKSLIGIADFLFQHVSKNDWHLFLSMISHEKLFKMMLGIDLATLKKSAASEDAFKANWQSETDKQLLLLCKASFEFPAEDKLRALILCLIQVYRVSREEGPNYKSNVGYYLGTFLSVSHDKELKLESCDVYREFLLSNPPHPLEDLLGYLQKNELAQKYQSSLMGTSMITQVLPSIVALATRLAAQMKRSAATVNYGTFR